MAAYLSSVAGVFMFVLVGVPQVAQPYHKQRLRKLPGFEINSRLRLNVTRSLWRVSSAVDYCDIAIDIDAATVTNVVARARVCVLRNRHALRRPQAVT